MAKEKPEVEEPSAPFWMVTYGDMVTLLMVFFILILSFSVIQLEKFKGAMSSMKGALGVMPENTSTFPKNNSNLQDHETKIRQEIFAKMEEIQATMAKMGLEDLIEMEYTGDGVIIRMGDNLFFDSGRASLKSQALPVLKVVVDAFSDEYKEIYVEGHTDNLPIRRGKYPSNWELSQARALTVVRFLNKKHGIPAKKLAAVGHGEHRPLVPNSNSANRAKNRRVEVYFRME
jgi:chemotaxis protein MotB